MFLLKQILPAAIVAMLVAAGVCGLALLWRNERARGALVPLAVGVAYAAGHLFIVGWVSFPPRDTTNWLPYFAVVAAIFGALVSPSAVSPEGRASARPGREESRLSETEKPGEGLSDGVLKLPAWARSLVFALVSAGALRLLLKPKFQYGWALAEGWIWVACLGSAMVLLAVVLDALARRSATRVEIPGLLLIVCAGAFGALMLSGSILLGQFAVILGAAVFGSLVLTARKVALGRGVGPVFSLLAGALLVSGYFFAELPATCAFLLALAPIFALVPIGAPSRLLASGIRMALVSVPVVIALVLAFRASPPLND